MRNFKAITFSFRSSSTWGPRSGINAGGIDPISPQADEHCTRPQKDSLHVISCCVPRGTGRAEYTKTHGHLYLLFRAQIFFKRNRFRTAAVITIDAAATASNN